MALVLSAAFGGKKEAAPVPTQNFDQAQAQLNALMGKKADGRK